MGPTSAPRSARLLTLAPKPSPRPHLSGAQQTSAGRWVSCACGSVGGGPCCGVSGVPAQKALPLGPDWLGPPGAPANGSRCAAGNVAGRRAGIGADDPRLRRPPPPLGADEHTGSRRYSLRPSLRLGLLISAKLGHHAGSPGPRLPPRPVPYINV